MHEASALLINPWIYDFAAFDFWAKPAGLLVAGSILREAGVRVHLVDCMDVHHPAMARAGLASRKRDASGRGKFHRERAETPDVFEGITRPYSRYGMPPALFARLLEEIDPPDVILVTCAMTYWYAGAFEAIHILKGRFPKAPVVLGGIYATLCPDHARRFSGADFVLEGPFEAVSPEAASDIPVLRELLPVPRRSLEDLPRPCLDLYPKLDHVPLMTSRGCPYRCAYCGVHLLFPGYEKRGAASVAEEIARWHRDRGIRNFAIYDDALLADAHGHLFPLLEAIADLNLPLGFHAASGMHIRGIDDAAASLLRRAGFETLRLGLETHRDDGRAPGDHKVTSKELDQAVASLVRAGYDPGRIGVYVLAGLPGQQVYEVEEAVDFVLGLGVRPHLAEYSPVPGSPMWKDAVRASGYDLESEPLTQNNTVFPCVPDAGDRARIAKVRNRLRNLFRP